ncbi:MAG TPA: ABC transporter permease [Clostridia bacterium]|nr:ABC transporter permease [Clostridia bacterium]
MLYYEMKKVFSRSGSKIALFILGVLIVVVVGSCVNSLIWVNEKGEEEKGFYSIQKLKEASSEWSGPLTKDRIAQVINENARINATAEAQSKDVRRQNIAYGWKQGFRDIRDLINNSFCEFREYNYYRVDSLSAFDAGSFYANRTSSLKRWLGGEAKYYYTEPEKEYFIGKYEKMKEPLDYEYMEGWKCIFEYSATILMIMTIIIGILIAPVFSCEKQLNSDAVFYTAYHGRGRAIIAKVEAGFLITTLIYWGMMLVYTCAVLSIFGAGGANCQIQAAGAWKSFYNLTNLQEYLIVIFGGYVGCIFMASLTMFVSAKSKSTVLAAIVPFVMIFAPSVSGFLNNRLLSEILGLFPDQLLQMNVVLKLFNVYEVGGKVVGAAGLLFTIYILLTLLLQPVTFQVFRKNI